MECSSGWSSQHDNFTVTVSWSVWLPCVGAERPVLWFTIHPLVVNTSSEETAPIAGYDSSLGVIVTAEEVCQVLNVTTKVWFWLLLFIFFAGYAYINMHTPMNVPVTVITKIVL